MDMDTNDTGNIEPCTQCGSSVYKKDQNGFLVCQNGHQLEGYWEEQTDFDPVFGLVRRLNRSSGNDRRFRRRAPEAKPEADKDVVKLGDVEGFTVLTAIQALLKAQVAALIKHFCVTPEGFEETVRALWCKYVTATGLQYSEEYVNRPNIEPLLFVERRPDMHYGDISTHNPYRRLPRLSITLCLLYMACVHCKMPLLLCELWQWAARGIIPYSSVLQFLSQEQWNILSWKVRQRFQQSRLPAMVYLHRQCGKLAGFLACYQHCPLPVVDPILAVWKGLDMLGMPLDSYPIAMRLLKDLDTRIDYRVCMRRGHRALLSEATVMAALVFLIKLIYGLKGYDSANPNRAKARYYSKLPGYGLPSYESLLDFWKKRLLQLKSDYVYNNKSVLYWCNLDKFGAEHKARQCTQNMKTIGKIAKEVPDLVQAIDRTQTPFSAAADLPPDPEAPQNPHRGMDINITKPVSLSMAHSCLVYGRRFRPEYMHRAFRDLLELAAMSIGLETRSLYRIYYSMFVAERD